MMAGLPQVTAASVVSADRVALIDTGPKSSLEAVLSALDLAGIDHLDWILVTHIHLDHSGGAGALLRRFPNARVGVHAIGAPHLVDPSKLWASATRIYGDRMDELWGGVDPVPSERVVVIQDRETIDLGGRRLTAFETTGHAEHHLAYLDDATGIMFVGDSMGVRLPDVGVARPATPPPEFNMQKALSSLELIREISPEAVWLAHFGPSDVGDGAKSVGEMIEAVSSSLSMWHDWIRAEHSRGRSIDETAELVEELETRAFGAIDGEASERMEVASAVRTNTWGFYRYLDKLSPVT